MKNLKLQKNKIDIFENISIDLFEIEVLLEKIFKNDTSKKFALDNIIIPILWNEIKQSFDSFLKRKVCWKKQTLSLDTNNNSLKLKEKLLDSKNEYISWVSINQVLLKDIINDNKWFNNILKKDLNKIHSFLTLDFFDENDNICKMNIDLNINQFYLKNLNNYDLFIHLNKNIWNDSIIKELIDKIILIK